MEILIIIYELCGKYSLVAMVSCKPQCTKTDDVHIFLVLLSIPCSLVLSQSTPVLTDLYLLEWHTTLFARIWIIRSTVFILLLQCSFKFYYRERNKERLRSSWPNISWKLDIVFATPILLQPPTFSLIIRVSNSSRDIPFFACDFNVMRSPVSLGGNSVPHSMELHCWVSW